MEAATSCSPSRRSSEIHDRGHDHDHLIGKGFRRRKLRPITVLPGQTSLRILCNVSAIGAVIGRSGTIVQQLERDTGTKIRVEDAVPDCDERLITVVGSEACDRPVSLVGAEGRLVSQAQEALLVVYDKVCEVQSKMECGGCSANGGACCRLLAKNGQVGAVMGRGGKTIEKMRNDTGAKIRILSQGKIPVCAAPGDELVQIMGSVTEVKKALVLVSYCLQDRPPYDRPPMPLGRATDVASSGDFPYSNMGILPHHDSISPAMPAHQLNHATASISALSVGFDRILSLDAKFGQLKVVFRLLCASSAVGGLIGKGGTIVKALQNETGASISVAANVNESDERVVTVFALENVEAPSSPSRNAMVRVFMRYVDASVEKGTISSFNDRLNVTAKLIVTENEVSCLMGKGAAVVSEIMTTTNSVVQILGRDNASMRSLENDEVLQITGECRDVRNALFQITGILRNELCSGFLLNFDQVRASSREVNHVEHDRKTGGGPPSRSRPSEAIGRESSDGGRHSKTFQGVLVTENESGSSKTTDTVIIVSAHQLGSIYGENGGNLARLKQISSAEVEVQDPSPGEPNGKVIISGTTDQVRAAQSLLQAFLLTR